MATLPSVDKIQRQAPRPALGIAQSPDVPMGELAMGTALQQAGSQFGSLSEEINREMQRVNKVRVEDAFSQLRNSQVDMTVGPDGFQQKKGGNAIKTPLLKDYSEKFNGEIDKISQSLENDNQRELFKQAAQVSKIQFTQDILQHLNVENKSYQKEVYNGAVVSEVRNASAQWNNPMAVAASLERIRAATNRYADENGFPEEYRNAAQLQDFSKVHSAVIGQALASKNFEYAKAWFDQYRDEIDPQTAKTLESSVEGAKQKQLTNGYTSAFLGSMNDERGLEGLAKKVLADTDLDDDRKNMLIGRIQSRGEVLANRAERARAQAERNMERQIGAINNLTLQGYEPTPEQIQPLLDKTKGTAFESQVKQMIQVANSTKTFRNATPQQQEVMLTQIETQARQDPTKFDVTMVNRLRTIYENQQRAIKQDPILFAVRQGQVDLNDPAAKPLDLSKPEAIGDQLNARFNLARGLQTRYQAPMKPLTSEEASMLSNTLKSATPAQRSQYFGSLSKSAGQDFDGYKAIMRQIAPDDPVTAIAGIYAGRGYTDQAGAGQAKSVSDLILRGQSVLNPNKKEDGSPAGGKLWPMPKETDMQKLFMNYERDAFAGHPQARSDLYQAAQSIYAAKSVEAGDSTGVLDSSRWRESMKLATGGIERYNGKSVVMPWGYDYGQFKDGLRQRIDAVVSSGSLADVVSASRVRDLPVENVGDGKYVFRSGDGVLVDKTGKPVLIDFSKEPVVSMKPEPKAISGTRTPGFN